VPFDLRSLLEPTTSAVVTSETQNAVLGPESYLPELAEAARPRVAAMARLVHGARRAGVQVVHGTFVRRADGRGANSNGRLFVAAARTAPPIEIVLNGGPTVRVPTGFDVRTLGDILAVLEGRPC
jgi:hypothetical protein